MSYGNVSLRWTPYRNQGNLTQVTLHLDSKTEGTYIRTQISSGVATCLKVSILERCPPKETYKEMIII